MALAEARAKSQAMLVKQRDEEDQMLMSLDPESPNVGGPTPHIEPYISLLFLTKPSLVVSAWCIRHSLRLRLIWI